MTKQTAFRFSDDTISKLDEMCRLLGTNRTAFLVLKIEQEYDAMLGNPKFKRVMKAITEMAEALSDTRVLADELTVDPVQLAIDCYASATGTKREEP